MIQSDTQVGSLLTAPEAARYLRVSSKTLETWRVRGDGPRFIRLNRAVRYKRQHLDEFVEAGTRRSTSDLGEARTQASTQS